MSVRRFVAIAASTIALLAPIAASAADPRTAVADAAAPWARVGFDQRLGDTVPRDARFADEAGRPIALGEATAGLPTVLALDYYDCPNLCSVVLQGAFESLARTGLVAGRDYSFVSVGIDPRERPPLARTTKAGYVARFHREADAAGLHFLTGAEPAIADVARAVGFRYFWDDRLRQYAHASGLVVLTPDGRVSRYLFGARFTTLSLRLALVEASQGAIGSLADRVWLLCYHYDPVAGRYGFAIVTILKGLGAAAALSVAGYLFVSLRRERRARTTPQPT